MASKGVVKLEMVLDATEAAAGTLIATRHFGQNGSEWVTVNGFPEIIEVADDLSDHVDPKIMRIEGDHLYVTAQNGEATYLLGERHPFGLPRRTAARLYARMDG